jgi:hypothetical protein
VSERYGLSIYDAMIAASALHAECDTLWSEDMQDGMTLENRLRIVNPFRGADRRGGKTVEGAALRNPNALACDVR